MKDNVMLFGLDNSIKLAQKISEILKIELSSVTKTVFADGEMMLVSDQTVRNKDVFIIANTATPVHENIMELLIFIDSLKRASAGSINVVLTYYGYARQDRKAKGRQPIGAKLVANLLETAGANKIITVDLHNPSIQGFFNIPVDDLRSQYILAEHLMQMKKKFSVVSPDHGGTTRARLLAELISNKINISIIDKRRIGTNQTEVMGLIGTIDHKTAVIVDDIIDTGGTILKAAEVIYKAGAKEIYIVASHGIFSKGFDIFENSPFVTKVIVTDSINNHNLDKSYSKLQIVSLDNFIANVITASYTNSSVSKVYGSIKDKLANI